MIFVQRYHVSQIILKSLSKEPLEWFKKKKWPKNNKKLE